MREKKVIFVVFVIVQIFTKKKWEEGKSPEMRRVRWWDLSSICCYWPAINVVSDFLNVDGHVSLLLIPVEEIWILAEVRSSFQIKLDDP